LVLGGAPVEEGTTDFLKPFAGEKITRRAANYAGANRLLLVAKAH